MKKLISLMFFMAVGMAAFAAPTVSDVIAKQRYPWNGLVDITCNVSGMEEGTEGHEFVVSAIVPDSESTEEISHIWVMKNGEKSTDLSVGANGDYRLIWDAKADLGEVRYPNMVVTITIKDPSVKEVEAVQLWEGGPYWATMNIGAEKPEDYGYYFWWGDTVGYKRVNDKWVSSDGSSSNYYFYNGNTPTFYKSESSLKSEGWITEDGVLKPECDAAHAHWGDDWRMPTKEEIGNLVSKCTWTKVTKNGVAGFEVRGNGEYASNSIFLPMPGTAFSNQLLLPDETFVYWSSTVEEDYGKYAWGLYYAPIDEKPPYLLDKNYRWGGLPIRPVK